MSTQQSTLVEHGVRVPEAQTRLSRWESPEPHVEPASNGHATAERPAWSPGTDTAGRNRCDRCGHHVSAEFRRQWENNDGILDGCRHCLPRSIRFGEDVYGRTREDVDEFDLDTPNKGRDPGGVEQKNDTSYAPEQEPLAAKH